MSQPIDARNGSSHHAGDAASAEWAHIREAMRGLRFGTVSIIIQDGVVVQIDRLEKRRIRRSEAANNSISRVSH